MTRVTAAEARALLAGVRPPRHHRAAYAEVDLMAAAPALAATVVELEAERDEANRARDWYIGRYGTRAAIEADHAESEADWQRIQAMPREELDAALISQKRAVAEAEALRAERDAAFLAGAKAGLEAAARHLRAYAAAGHGKDGGALSAAAARIEAIDPSVLVAARSGQ